MNGLGSFSCSSRICTGISKKSTDGELISHTTSVPAVLFHTNIQEYKPAVQHTMSKKAVKACQECVPSLIAYVVIVNCLTLAAWGMALWKTYFFWKIINFFYPYDKTVCAIMATITTAGEWWSLVPAEIAAFRVLVFRGEEGPPEYYQFLSNDKTVALYNSLWNELCRSLRTNMRRHRRGAFVMGLVIAFIAQIPYSDLNAYVPLLWSIRVVLLTLVQYYSARYCETLCQENLVRSKRKSVVCEDKRDARESEPEENVNIMTRPVQFQEYASEHGALACTSDELFGFILDTRLDEIYFDQNDHLLEDYLLTSPLFIDTPTLCKQLMLAYSDGHINHRQNLNGYHKDSEELNKIRKRVVRFVYAWYRVTGSEYLFSQRETKEFLKNFCDAAHKDGINHLEGRLVDLGEIMNALYHEDLKKIDVITDEQEIQPIRPTDTYTINVDKKRTGWSRDWDPVAIKVTPTTTALAVIQQAANMLEMSGQLVLVEVKSDNTYTEFLNDEMCIAPRTAKGQLFLSCRGNHPELRYSWPFSFYNAKPSEYTSVDPQLLAYHCTCIHWEMFRNIHEYEYLHYVLGRTNGTTANLDLLLLHCWRLRSWVTNQIHLAYFNSHKADLMRTFILTADHCRKQHNYLGFTGITLGLLNSTIVEMRGAWRKVAKMYKSMLDDFARMVEIDTTAMPHEPGTNLKTPFVPNLPLLLKGMKNAYGDSSHNAMHIVLKAMHTIADNLRIVRCCKTVQLEIPRPPVREPSKLNIRREL